MDRTLASGIMLTLLLIYMFPSLVSVQPVKAASTSYGVVKTKILEPGDDLIHGFVYYDGYLWASTRTSPCRILKIDPETLDYERAILDAGLNDGEDLIVADGDIWTILWTSPSKVIRVDPETLTWEVAVAFQGSELSYGSSLEYAFGYLWAGGANGKIARIDLNTLTYELYSYPMVGDFSYFAALISGDGYVWGQCPHYSWWLNYYYATTVVRFNPSNPADYTSVYMGVGALADDVGFADSHFYTASETSPSYVYKISDSLTYVSSEISDTVCYGVSTNNNHIWGACVGSPGKIVELDLDLNIIATCQMPGGFNNANEIAFDAAGNMYATCWESPARIVKFSQFPAWEKTVKVVPGGILPGSEIGAKVSYNWVRTDEQGKDVFQITRIEGWSQFFVGAYRISIESESGTLWSNLSPATPLWRTYYPEQLYAYADDWISVKAYGFTEKEALGLWSTVARFAGLPSLPPGDIPFFIGHDEDYLAPPYIDTSGFPPIAEEGEVYPMICGCICSPGELRIYDAQGRVTGLVSGEIKEEIPNSAYLNGIIVILSQIDSYRYEVVGTEEEEYELAAISVEAEEANVFSATNIPTANETTHSYVFDWAALSLGEEGVTAEVDLDGDSVPEYTFTSDGNLSRFEYVASTTKHDLGITGIASAKSVIGEGFSLPMNITVVNYGVYTETLNVAIYANATPVATQVVTLANATSTTITYAWNTTGVAYGNYTINAYVTPVPGEIYVGDNTLVDGTVTVTIAGDIQGDTSGSPPDGDVDYSDFIILAGAYGSTIGQPAYNPEPDIDGDGDVDYDDFIALAGNYGKHL